MLLPSGRYSSDGNVFATRNDADAVIRATHRNAMVRRRISLPINHSVRLTNLAAISSTTGILIRTRLLPSSAAEPSHLRDRAGMTVTDTNNERSTATDMATAISRNNCPTSSFDINTGTKTRTVVKADTRTAPQTCCAPLIAASRREWPDSRIRKIFSRITIAASTTKPTAKAIPASDMTLMERPSAAMATNAPTMDTGMAIEMVKVARIERRNSSITSAASMPPTQIFC